MSENFCNIPEERLTGIRMGDNSTELNISVDKLNKELFSSLFPLTIFIGLEAVFGLIGNISILCVYTKLYLHCNFRYFVLCLAFYDITSCVATIPAEVVSEFYWYNFKFTWYCKLKSYFNVFTVWGSAFTLLLLAFDRYRKVCQPLGWQIQPSCALKLCAVGIVISSLVSVPASVFWGIQNYVYTVGNASVTVSICEKSGWYVHEIYPFIYITSVYAFPIGLMMTAICVWNVLTARQMFCKMSEIRTSSSAGNGIVRVEPPESTSMSFQSFVSAIMRKIIRLKKACCSEDGHCRMGQSRRNSMTSLTSFTLTELPSQTSRGRFYITTDFGETRPKQETSALNSNNRYSRQISNNSTGSNSTVDRFFSREIRSEGTELRRKRKTMMMLILTSVFIVTTTLYIILVSLIAEKHSIFKNMTNSQKVWYFFFLRIYFINSVINPILYGLMDPRFRTGLKKLFCTCGAAKRV